jgi:hypothetical protein
VSKGTDLVGYVPRRTGVFQLFNTPKKSWSTKGRKFKKLNKKQIKEIIEQNT